MFNKDLPADLERRLTGIPDEDTAGHIAAYFASQGNYEIARQVLERFQDHPFAARASKDVLFLPRVIYDITGHEFSLRAPMANLENIELYPEELRMAIQEDIQLGRIEVTNDAYVHFPCFALIDSDKGVRAFPLIDDGDINGVLRYHRGRAIIYDPFPLAGLISEVKTGLN